MVLFAEVHWLDKQAAIQPIMKYAYVEALKTTLIWQQTSVDLLNACVQKEAPYLCSP